MTQPLARSLQKLEIHLRRLTRGGLLIAAADSTQVELAVMAALQRRFDGQIAFEAFCFTPDQISLSSYLRSRPEPAGPTALFAFGLDNLPPDSRQRAIQALNLGRERLRWAGRSVVLWVRPDTLHDLTFQAPDFWAWRRGVFEFTLPQDPAARETALKSLQLHCATELEALRASYLDYLVSAYRWLDFRGLMQVRNLVRLPLAQVYVPLTGEEVEVGGWDRERVGEGVEDEWGARLHRPAERKSRPVALADAVRENRRLVVLGDPGSGKSTLLRFLALTFAEGADAVRERLGMEMGMERARLPLLVPISAYSLVLDDEPGLALETFIPRRLERLGLPDLGPLLTHDLESGRALLLLDGLDEVVSAAGRARVAAQIRAFLSRYPANRTIVASRIAGYQAGQMPANFTQLTIRPFNQDEIARFAQSWSRAYEAAGDPAGPTPEGKKRAAERAESLVAAVTSRPAIERLATNPLLLTLLALIHYQGTRLPAQRAELYRLCVEALAESWNLARSLSGRPVDLWLAGRRLDERLVVSLLAPVAFWLHGRRPGGLITREELEGRIAGSLAKADDEAKKLAADFVDLVREQVGLLVERGPDQFAFMHLTFEEYLAARYLAGRKDAFKLLRPRLHHPRWREVVLLTAASLQGEYAADFVRRIRQARSRYERLLHRDLLLAGRCLADEAPVDHALQAKIVRDLVKLALYSRYTRLQEESRAVLGDLPPVAARQALPPLLAALRRDADEWVRRHAAEALGALGTTEPAVAEGLLEALRRDSSEWVRGSAAGALGKLEAAEPVVVEGLLETLRQDDNEWVRGDAAEALGKIDRDNPRTLPVLRRSLRDRSPQVRAGAAVGLAALNRPDPAAVRYLVGRLRLSSRLPPRWDRDNKEVWAGERGRAPVYDHLFDALWALVEVTEGAGA